MEKTTELITLGQEIRRRRKALKCSQEGFAIKYGIDRSYYGRIERGEANLTMLVLLDIAKGLNVKVQELVACLDK